MSVEKVKDYLNRESKGVFRRGYSEVLPLIQSDNCEELLRVLGSVERVETVVGIGTNNRAENFQFPTKYLSIVESYEQRAQKAFNDEYMARVEALDKLRIEEVVFQLGETLQNTKYSSMLELSSEDKLKELVPSGGFAFATVSDEGDELEHETLSVSQSDELGLQNKELDEESDFTKFFSDLED